MVRSIKGVTSHGLLSVFSPIDWSVTAEVQRHLYFDSDIHSLD